MRGLNNFVWGFEESYSIAILMTIIDKRMIYPEVGILKNVGLNQLIIKTAEFR